MVVATRVVADRALAHDQPRLPAATVPTWSRPPTGVRLAHRRVRELNVVDQRTAVVVITHNRAEELLRTLERMTSLPERPPIVVLDNASSDDTAASVRRRFQDVDVVPLAENIGAAARNIGMRRCDTPYVAFCDDDTWWEPGALTLAADVLDAHRDIAVVTGHVVVEPDGADDPVCEEMRDSPVPGSDGTPGPHILSFLAGASVVRREAALAAGGFHPRLHIGGEEALLACDLAADGWSLVHVPEVRVHHWPSVARDPHVRRRGGIRNALWFFWLRRPVGAAAVRTAHMLRSAPPDRHTVAAVGDAVRGLAWVVRERRVVPPSVEEELRLLDGPQMRSKARRYLS